MKKILVLGGAGYIGDLLVDDLIEQGYSVTVYDNLLYESAYAKYGARFLDKSVLNFEALKFELANHDVCVNLAAIVGDGACAVEPNASKAVNLGALEFISKNFKGHLIWPSSCSVYGNRPDIARETSEVNPLSLYGELKVAGEALLRNYRGPLTVLRYGTVYGATPLARPRFDLIVNTLVREAVLEKKIVVGSQKQSRPHVHVADAAKAIVHAIQTRTEGLFNICSENATMLELAARIRPFGANGTEILIQGDTREDFRNYEVDNSASLEAGFTYTQTIEHGARELRKLILESPGTDWYNPRYSNKHWLQNTREQ